MSKPANFPTKPGFYIIRSGPLLVYIELEPDGTVHQLSPEEGFKRDGVLDDDGWNNARPMRFQGPFQKMFERHLP